MELVKENIMYICDEETSKKIVKDILSLKYNISPDFGFEIVKNPFRVTFWVLDNERRIAGFTLVQQINCCGLLISTKTWVEKEFQGRGIAQEMMILKEELAKGFGFSSIMATVNITGNPAESHILEKFNWTCVNKFKNSRTGNTVGIYIKNLER